MPNIEEKKDHRTIEIVFLNEAKKRQIYLRIFSDLLEANKQENRGLLDNIRIELARY